MIKMFSYLSAMTIILVLAGCAQYENKRGVLDHWQENDGESFTAGETTRQDVLERLGPPSQVIALGDETALYYLYEHSAGTGLVLILYNQFKVDTRYDRAIFFFDENDRLTDHSSYFAAKDGS